MEVKKIISGLIILSIHAYATEAQEIIQGRVTDSGTGEFLQGVHIQILPGEKIITSNKDGYFQFTKDTIAEGLLFTHIGYHPRHIILAGSESIIRVQLNVKANQLREFVVGFESRKSLMQTPASISVLSPADLQRFDDNSLLPAVNTLPGVRMEERSPGSYRFSIRGSLIRSPFGVRNIKVYLNEIPLTDPTGNTQLNLLDFYSIGKVEVVKGPAGSIYGAGTGGVVKLESKKPAPGETFLNLQGIAGSYGLQGMNLSGGSANEKVSTLINYSKRSSEGYREHSAMRREMFNWQSSIKAGENQSVTINSFYSDLFYQIPGGIDETTYRENPRAARQGSAEQNSSISLKTFHLGASHQFSSGRFNHTTSLFAVNTAFDHPFILDYKRSSEQGYGFRTVSSYILKEGRYRTKVSAGSEFMNGFISARNYDNSSGNPGNLRLDDEISAENLILFIQTETELPNNFLLTAGSSYNRVNYGVLRLSSPSGAPDHHLRRNFLPVFSPRVALLKEISENLVAHSSLSYGFSPPTVTEIRTSEGSLNEAIRPESGINYETGIRGKLLNEKLNFDLTFYSMSLRNTIVSHTDQNGVVLFRNTGNTLQNGIESMINFEPVKDSKGFLKNLRIFSSYTYNLYSFRNYLVNENNYSGNRMTGVAPHIAVTGMDAGFKTGFYLNLTSTYTDAIPLNDANTVYAEDFFILTGRIGLRKTFKKFSFDVFAGANNIGNRQYSLGNDLNAFGGRYYQPSPGRNYFAGTGIKYLISK